MTADGPDMAAANAAVADPSVKAFGACPSIPTQPAAPTATTSSSKSPHWPAPLLPTFAVLWDNAYAVHDLYETGDTLASIFTAATAARWIMSYNLPPPLRSPTPVPEWHCFGLDHSTDALDRHYAVLTVGHDKVNQLRHVVFTRSFRYAGGPRAIIRPKFELVEEILFRELGGLGIASWTKPRGGYFVSLDVPGLARKIIAMAKAVGLTLTPQGPPFPTGMTCRTGIFASHQPLARWKKFMPRWTF